MVAFFVWTLVRSKPGVEIFVEENFSDPLRL